MAVYTEVADEELNAFIASYDIGALTSCKGIAEGVENSNYLVQTEAGRYILTLYEKRVAPKDLPYFLALMEHLAARGISCPLPVHDRAGTDVAQACRQARGAHHLSRRRLSAARLDRAMRKSRQRARATSRRWRELSANPREQPVACRLGAAVRRDIGDRADTIIPGLAGEIGERACPS